MYSSAKLFAIHEPQALETLTNAWDAGWETMNSLCDDTSVDVISVSLSFPVESFSLVSLKLACLSIYHGFYYSQATTILVYHHIHRKYAPMSEDGICRLQHQVCNGSVRRGVTTADDLVM